MTQPIPVRVNTRKYAIDAIAPNGTRVRGTQHDAIRVLGSKIYRYLCEHGSATVQFSDGTWRYEARRVEA